MDPVDKNQMRKVQKELRQQKISESLISEVIPEFYEEKCGKFRYPLIPFDAAEWKQNPKAVAEPKVAKGQRTPRHDEVWTYKKFENKLSNGVLTIPALNLEQVPKSIFGFSPPLRIIYLKDNALRELPSNFFNDLPILAWLDVRNNKLRSIPDLDKPHEGLRTLLLENNQIECLPLSLHRAAQLATILLRGNPIVDPPLHIIRSGTPIILAYLADQFQNPNDSDDESEMDEAMTLPRPNPRREQGSLIIRSISEHSGGDFRLPPMNSERELPKSKVLQTLYSDGLWRHAPHEGPGPFQILAKAQEEMRTNIQRKFTAQKEAILQRMKDKEALLAFRTTAQDLQRNGVGKKKGDAYQGPNAPFGTSSTLDIQEGIETVGMEEFYREFIRSLERLNFLTANPVPLDDIRKAKKRLDEVEEIQRKITNMKLSMKIQI